MSDFFDHHVNDWMARTDRLSCAGRVCVSDTPRTDAMPRRMRRAVPEELVQEMERDLNAARAELDALRREVNATIKRLDRAQRELGHHE